MNHVCVNHVAVTALAGISITKQLRVLSPFVCSEVLKKDGSDGGYYRQRVDKKVVKRRQRCRRQRCLCVCGGWRGGGVGEGDTETAMIHLGIILTSSLFMHHKSVYLGFYT